LEERKLVQQDVLWPTYTLLEKLIGPSVLEVVNCARGDPDVVGLRVERGDAFQGGNPSK
jgi:hypothetical protein